MTDEDLAIVLYAVQRNSFCVAEDHNRQWTCGYDAIRSMAEALKEEGLTKRSFGNRNKVSACKIILESSGLIDCIDREWIYSGKQTGISQKYTIGKNHWRYQEFVLWSQDIQVKYIVKKEVAA